MRDISLGTQKIGANSPVFIIAEIGINHNGSLKTAKRLIDAAVEAGANCVKFQMRDLSSLYVNKGNPDDPSENLGSQYTLDLLTRFELSPEDMFSAFDYCKKRGIMPLCTPWDIESLKRLEKYGMEAYKVASADMTNHVILREMAKTRKPLIVSTGMSEEKEIKQTALFLKKLGVSYILMHCNSTYPPPFKDVNLSYLARLQKIGNCPVGYSGHERGFHIPIAAVAIGATVIEKHITLDRSMEGNDHKVSLLPHEFKQMVEMIRETKESLGDDSPRKITQGERLNRISLAKSLIAAKSIKLGQKITQNMITVKSPGRGLQPSMIDKLTGQTARRDIKVGDFFFLSDFKTTKNQKARIGFNRPVGIPVRYHDFKKLIKGSSFDFVEFHLTYKDMEQNFKDFISQKYDLGVTVHSPDLFPHDFLLDLASSDREYRAKSIQELSRVVKLVENLSKYFNNKGKTLIVASVGGWSKDKFCDLKERKEMYKRVADSLEQIDQKNVEIIPQTMPPFPWYFGGQFYQNLFVDPSDMAEFCKKYGTRLCFDVSHSKLACNYFGWSFDKFIDQIGPYIAQMHIADAKDIDGEGLQIGEGDVDFAAVAKRLKKLAPMASFIPEIWQGHENNGEGFVIALNKLTKWF